ncbi:hypothetical protein GEV29_09015 [Aeromicrobium sp. SMF47]|uniref:Uncharacterized protein n=1 Tax=Aeromicrobium yanjiei TaxID=2662028 RepID=A0A5Q2MNT6_9ACTN|nr:MULTISPECIES: hypothetical protein [Aeromicrobium]MRJ76675.1 hypothetical protein [Aeromicrobium yanjiei]MRK01020.1 hypothetical protein [Aeromicrobium sp. S22]QGG42175.1 hypothetical protein GEV26_12810 [Aeromicrobium yanjiei]
MRWDRLFADLEGQAADLELEERDALVDDLSDGEWAETSWRDLLGGHVVIEVRGAGRVEGEAVLVNGSLIRVRGDTTDQVVAVAAVATILEAQRRADEGTLVSARLGWGQVFRALRDAGDTVMIRLLDGTSREGVVDVVGRDFVRLRSGSGRDQVVLWSALALVSGRS